MGDGLITTWVEETGTTNSLKVQKIVNGQFAWDEPSLIVSDSPDSLGVNAYREGYLIWVCNRTDLYATKLDPDGNMTNGWAEGGNLIAETNGKNKYSINSMRLNGDLVLAWEDYSMPSYSLRIQIVHNDSSTEWDYGYLVPGTGSYLSYLNMYYVDGYLYFIWKESTSEVPTTLYMQKYDLACNPFWDEPLTIISADISWSDLRFAQTSVGFLIGYRLYTPDNEGFFPDDDLYLQHLNYDGTLWDEPMVICDMDYIASSLNIVPAGGNRFYLTWLDSRQGCEEMGFTYYPYYDVYAQLFDLEVVDNDNDSAAPCPFRLIGNSPNPFNPQTTIEYSLATKSDVEICIYNVRGQRVKKLLSETIPQGHHKVVWDGCSDTGNDVASGVYFYRMKVDGNTVGVRKMLLLK